MNTKRIIVSILYMICATAILWFGFYYNVSSYGKRFAQTIPRNIDGMDSSDIKMDRKTLDILETEDVLLREYLHPDNPNEPMFLCVIFSENNRKVAHPPELCLSGGGNTVEEKTEIKFDSSVKGNFDAKRLIVNHGYQKWMYLYFYKTGDFFSSNYLLQQFLAAVTQLIYRKSSCALIRISTPIPANEEPPYKQTEARIVDFTKKALPFIAEKLP